MSSTVEDFGTVGTADDSATFNAMLASEGYIACKPKTYSVKDLLLEHTALYGNGATLVPATGAKYVARLKGWRPKLHDVGFIDTNDAVVRTTTLSAAAAANAMTISVSSATGLEIGQFIAIRLDGANYVPDYHGTFINSINGSTIGLERGLRSAAASGQSVIASWGLVNNLGSECASVRGLHFNQCGVGIVSERDGATPTSKGRWQDVTIYNAKYAALVEGRDLADMQYDQWMVRGGHVEQRAYTGNGTKQDYWTWWPIFLKRDISVTVNGAPKVQGIDYDVAGPWAIWFYTAPANGAAIVVYNFTDGWFGHFNDQKGWGTIRGGCDYQNMNFLDFYFGRHLREKEWMTGGNNLIDTCQNGDFIRDCSNIALNDQFIGFCNRTIDADNAPTYSIAGRSRFSYVPNGMKADGTNSPASMSLGAGATLKLDGGGIAPGSVTTKTGSGTLTIA